MGKKGEKGDQGMEGSQGDKGVKGQKGDGPDEQGTLYLLMCSMSKHEYSQTLEAYIYSSLRASSLGGGGREGERGESPQRCLRNFHFCVEFFNAKC